MRSECVNHKFVYESALQTERLLTTVADLHQRATQSYVRRPYGVGLLVAGHDDKTGPRLFQTCPSGNMYEWKAYALGARLSAASTTCVAEVRPTQAEPCFTASMAYST